MTETAIVIKCRCGLAFFALSAEEAREDHLAHYLESSGGEDHMAGNEMPISHPINNIHSVCRIMAAERKFEDAKVQVERRKQFAEAPGYERAFGLQPDTEDGFFKHAAGHLAGLFMAGVCAIHYDEGSEGRKGLLTAFWAWLGVVVIALASWYGYAIYRGIL